MVSLILRLDHQIKQYREESAKAMNEIDETYGETMQVQHEQRQELLHMETVNMMSKYQIVYQKMETVLSNWTESMKLKSEKQGMRRAFGIMKDRANVHRRAKQLRSQLIYRKL